MRIKMVIACVFLLGLALQAAPTMAHSHQETLQHLEVIQSDLEERLSTEDNELDRKNLALCVALIDKIAGVQGSKKDTKLIQRASCEEPCVRARVKAYQICAQYYTGTAYSQCIAGALQNYQRCLAARGCI